MRIAMPRGDIYYIQFTVSNDEDSPEIDFDEIYFTVKKKYTDPHYLFQKRLTTGGIIKTDANTYRIKISPEDTNNLPFSKPTDPYDFDIELIYGNTIKTTLCGEFVLTKESTWASNEG